ncbi:MAG: hypothetical protein RR625_07020, partial [Christensenellaceae bacterium]
YKNRISGGCKGCPLYLKAISNFYVSIRFYSTQNPQHTHRKSNFCTPFLRHTAVIFCIPCTFL